jgi:hypothetical protein
MSDLFGSYQKSEGLGLETAWSDMVELRIARTTAAENQVLGLPQDAPDLGTHRMAG